VLAQQQAISVPFGTYLVQVVATGSTTVVASEQIDLIDQSVTLRMLLARRPTTL
jgi:hypothetical protein